MTVSLGVEVGAAYLRQRYRPDDRASARHTAAFTLAVQSGVERALAAGFYVTALVSGVTYVFDAADRHGDIAPRTVFVPRFALGLGKRF